MKKEVKEWLKSSGLTEEDLDFMWDFCVFFGHRVIGHLDSPTDKDKKWRSLHLTLIQQIPREYEKMVKQVIYEEE